MESIVFLSTKRRFPLWNPSYYKNVSTLSSRGALRRRRVVEDYVRKISGAQWGVNVDVHEIFPPFGRLNDNLVWLYPKIN